MKKAAKKNIKTLRRQHKQDLKRRRTEAIEHISDAVKSLSVDLAEAINRIFIVNQKLDRNLSDTFARIDPLSEKIDRALEEPKLCAGCSGMLNKKGAKKS